MSHLDNLLEYSPEIRQGRVLDVGVGQGEFFLECKERGIDVHGLETNPSYIELVKRKAHAKGLDVTIAHGGAEETPFPNASFTFANCSELIEHVEEPRGVLQELYRILVPGGKAYISVHNRFGIYDWHFHLWFLNWLPRALGERYISLFRKEKSYGDFPDRQRISEMQYFTYGSFRRLARDVGFSVRDIREEKISRLISWPLRWFAIFLYRMLRVFSFNTFHILLKK